MSDYAYQDLIDHIQEEHEAEGAKPNRSHYLRLMNSALEFLFEQAKQYSKTWDSADVTVVGAQVKLPTDCIEVTDVRWKGQRLILHSRGEMNKYCSTWSVETSTDPEFYIPEGMTFMLNPIPSASITNLTITGFAYPDRLPITEGQTDPLAYIPRGSQLLLANYVLANLPYDPESPMQSARVARNQAQWERGWPTLVSHIQSFKSEPYGAS